MNPFGYAAAAWMYIPDDKSECVLQATTKSWAEMWATPIDISKQYRNSWWFSNNVGGGESKLAINANGNLAIVWVGYKHKTYISEKSYGQEWTEPYCLSDTSAVSTNPEAVVDNLGNITAVWVEFNGKFILKSSTKTVGSNWSSDIVLSPNLLSDGASLNLPITYPKIIIDREGNTVAVWTKYISDSSYIQVATKALGKNWNTSQDVHFVNGTITNLQLGIDSNQNILLLWEEETSDQRSIRSIIGLKQ